MATRLVLLAEHSGKPSFSLGLQSFLKLLLHKIRVPRVSHRVHEVDAVSQKQLDKAVVHGMHAVLSADLNKSRYLRKPSRPDTRLDSRVHGQQFRGQDQAYLAASREKILAHHSQQRPSKLRTDELLALLRNSINNSPNGGWCVVGVHGSDHKVSRFRRRNCGLDRVQIPQLSNKNDVRILSQRVLEC